MTKLDYEGVDVDATVHNVDRLLSKYHTIRRLSGRPVPQKLTAVISETPKSPSPQVTLEDKVLDKIAYGEQLSGINRAISLLDKDSQNLLWGKYIAPDRKTDYEVYSRLAVSKSTYYRWLDEARVKFAEAYHSGELLERKSTDG